MSKEDELYGWEKWAMRNAHLFPPAEDDYSENSYPDDPYDYTYGSVSPLGHSHK